MNEGPILLVEDDLDIQENLRQFLELEGYAVESALNGEEALEFLRAGRTASLILLDLMMPVMNGYEFLDELAREPAPWARTPVVLLSAATDIERVARQMRVRHVKKPINLDQLMTAIRGGMAAA